MVTKELSGARPERLHRSETHCDFKLLLYLKKTLWGTINKSKLTLSNSIFFNFVGITRGRLIHSFMEIINISVLYYLDYCIYFFQNSLIFLDNYIIYI